MATKPTAEIEMVYVVDGDLAPRTRRVAEDATAGEVVKIVARELGREDLEDMYLEDQEKPVSDKAKMGTVLQGEFQVIHIGGKHDVKVEVSYNGRAVHRQFAPSITIRSIIAWAISPKGLDLQGDAADFQLKHNGEILPLELHVGQIAHGRETVGLVLVFKVKPQG